MFDLSNDYCPYCLREGKLAALGVVENAESLDHQCASCKKIVDLLKVVTKQELIEIIYIAIMQSHGDMLKKTATAYLNKKDERG